MRILITGARGQLGNALQARLADHTLLATDVPELDITDYDMLLDTVTSFAPDVVIHCAAYTDVDGCAADPALAYRINGLGTQHVALACLESGAAMVHLSTNEVFSGSGHDGYEEWMPVDPINPYARSKAAAEFHVRGLLARHYIVRTAWLYAPSGKNFIHSILRLAREGRPLRVVADEIGNPTYVVDLAAAIAALITTGRYGTYHLVNEGSCSRLAFAREALRLSGLPAVEIAPILSRDYKRASSPPLYSALKNVAGAAIGIRLRPWEDALAEYIDHYWQGS